MTDPHAPTLALNPTVAALVAASVAAGRPALADGTPAQARALLETLRPGLGTGPAILRAEPLTIPGRAGPIPARLYADTPTPAGLVVYFHGGGWVIGTLDDFEPAMRVLAQRSRCAILLPDYRLAPEHPFPAAIDDAVDATLWAHANATRLAGPGRPLLLAGDSAGGNLATIAAAETAAQVHPAAQVLVYPVTGTDLDTPSYHAYDAPGLLTRADMAWFLGHYAPNTPPSHPRLCPAARTDLATMPPTTIFTAEVDVLRDDGERYAAQLAAAGIPTTLRRVEGLPHAFLRMFNLVPEADAALTEIAAALAAPCRAP